MSTAGAVRIDAGTLIPGRGEPFRPGSLLMENGAIAYAGPPDGAPAEGAERTFRVPALMPGMWDCHAHFFGTEAADLNLLAVTPLPVMAVRAARDAVRVLRAGFTSVRELGGVGVYLARLVEEGTLDGPDIYAAGAALGPTGGHSDLHWMPERWRDELALSGKGWVAVCDGVEECIKQVRRQVRLGAQVIKVNATGGTMSQTDHPRRRQFNDKELRAIVEEAALAELAVAAHCHGLAGVAAAARAGVATIEHCSALDEPTVELLLERGVIIVPTRMAVTHLLTLRGQIPEVAWQSQAEVAASHTKALRLAIEAGLPIATGADIMCSGGQWGQNGQEAGLLVEAGMTPLQAVEAATARGPATLGPRAPRTGLLAAGYAADVIAVSADPLSDISLLADPDNITMVWKGGRLLKSPHAPEPHF